MTTTTVPTGATRSTPLTMTGSDKLLIQAGATLTVSDAAESVLVDGQSDAITIENNGLLENAAWMVTPSTSMPPSAPH